MYFLSYSCEVESVDKRRYERLPRDLQLSYTIIAKVDSTPFEFGNSVMSDISRSGLAMLVDMPIPVPMLLQLQLRVPNRPTSTFVLGKSIYCVPVEEVGMYRVGIRFVGILPSDMEDILDELRGSEDMASGF
jgi:hypothetical protein